MEDEMGEAYSMHGSDENACKILVRRLAGKRPLRRPKPTRKDNLKSILKKQEEMMWTGFIWLRTGSVVSSCKHCNEP
jgi:hypothetical protein